MSKKNRSISGEPSVLICQPENVQSNLELLNSETSTELPLKPEIVAMPPEIGRFIPPACCMCAAIVPENRRTTYIDGTKRVVNGPDEMVITRSIRCDKCGNTWTHKELIRHKKSSEAPQQPNQPPGIIR